MRVIPKRHLDGGFFDAAFALLVARSAQSETDEAYLVDDDEWATLCRGQAALGKRRRSDDEVANPTKRPGTSKLAEAYNLADHALHGAVSIAKTSIGIDRATDEQVEARLNVCRKCPGNHAIWKDGKVHTCGPMLESGKGTCGCILRRKARDQAEECPFGWWPV